jgi:hypothetical protein
MNLDDLVATVQRDLLAALPEGSPAAGDAERLASAVDSSLRLSIIRAVAVAAEELSEDLSPGTVSVTLGPDGTPRLRADGLSTDGPAPAAPDETDPPEPGLMEPSAEAESARLTLRMPSRLKARAESAAERAGVSTNRWLTQAIETALQPHPTPTAPRSRTQHVSGWLN